MHSFTDYPRETLYDHELIDKSIMYIMEDQIISDKTLLLVQKIQFHCYCNCCCTCGGLDCQIFPMITLIAWSDMTYQQLNIFEINMDKSSRYNISKCTSLNIYNWPDCLVNEAIIRECAQHQSLSLSNSKVPDLNDWIETMEENRRINSWLLKERIKDDQVIQLKHLKSIYHLL